MGELAKPNAIKMLLARTMQQRTMRSCQLAGAWNLQDYLMTNFKICTLHLCQLLADRIHMFTIANTTVDTALGQCN